MHLADRPFYVAAPWTTFDLSCADGEAIPIEERDGLEVTHIGAEALTAPGAKVRNPAFDVTPAAWVRALITERGVIRAPLAAGISERK
jgi:methylthioribose-1-phosphate isomerase